MSPPSPAVLPAEKPKGFFAQVKANVDEINAAKAAEKAAEESTPEGKVRKQNEDRLKSLSSGQLFVGKELRTLVSQLMPLEELRSVAAGTYENKQGVVVLTDVRLFFYEKGLLFRERTEEFQISAISSVQAESGMMMAKLKVHASNNIAEIKHIVPKQRAKEIAELLRESINRKPSETAPAVTVNIAQIPAATGSIPAAGGDLTHRLSQLKQMLDAGLLTQDEFDVKKAEILSCL